MITSERNKEGTRHFGQLILEKFQSYSALAGGGAFL